MTRLGAAMDVRFEESVEEFIELITSLGLNHIELKREYLEGHPDAPPAAAVGELAEQYDISVTYHAPFRDWNIGSFNDAVREASVDQVRDTLDDALAADAEGVVLHGGSVPYRYPEWVRQEAAANARRSLVECAEYADDIGVPLCLENQPRNDSKQRYTTTPTALAETLAEVPVSAETLQVTLDIGHAKVNGEHWQEFVDQFGDRIHICHLHHNDGNEDTHEPLTEHNDLVDAIPANIFVFEMKDTADIAQCVRPGATN